MIKMLEIICAIPENIGWVMVGSLGTLCVMMLYRVGKLFIEMWRERHEEEE